MSRNSIALAALLVLLGGSVPAYAQHVFGAPATIGTSPTQVLPQSNVRRRLRRVFI